LTEAGNRGRFVHFKLTEHASTEHYRLPSHMVQGRQARRRRRQRRSSHSWQQTVSAHLTARPL